VQAVLSKFPGAQIVNVIERAEKAGENGDIETMSEADVLAAHEADADDEQF
jgi:DNA polymerase-3 subunit gamma/tau